MCALQHVKHHKHIMQHNRTLIYDLPRFKTTGASLITLYSWFDIKPLLPSSKCENNDLF